MAEEEEFFDVEKGTEGEESEFVSEEEAEQGPAAIKSLREKLKKAVAEKQEYMKGWQRARADFANYKREEANINADREERMKGSFIEDLLPALDTFEMALKHAPSTELELVHQQLTQSLQKLGVERFGKVGEAFDPYRHEALAQKGDGETVESLERSGYSIGNKIIRAAQVII